MNFTEKFLDAYRKIVEENLLLKQQLKELKEKSLTVPQKEHLTVPQKEPEEDIYSLDYINKNILKENRFTNEEIDMLVKYKQVNTFLTNSSNAHKVYTLRHLIAILNKIDVELRINPNYFTIDNDRNLRNQIEFIPVIWKYARKFGYDVKFYLKKGDSRFYYYELNHLQIQEISAEKIFDTPHNWRYCQFHFTKLL